MTDNSKKPSRPRNVDRAAIEARLRQIPNATFVAAEFGLRAWRVQEIALPMRDEVGCVRQRTIDGNPRYLYLLRITGGLSLRRTEEEVGLPARTLSALVSEPERLTVDRIRNSIIPKLLRRFPDKASEISSFEIITCALQPMSAHQIKLGKNSNEFRDAAVLLLRDMRTETGQTLEMLLPHITHPLVKKHLSRIDAGDPTLGRSIMRAGVEVLSRVYQKLAPDVAKRYTPWLAELARRLD